MATPALGTIPSASESPFVRACREIKQLIRNIDRGPVRGDGSYQDTEQYYEDSSKVISLVVKHKISLNSIVSFDERIAEEKGLETQFELDELTERCVDMVINELRSDNPDNSEIDDLSDENMEADVTRFIDNQFTRQLQ